jgi:NAD dependent epimerase/dehydratase
LKLRNLKILVTGADGFIGSHLTERLIQDGAKVKALAYYNSFNYWGWLEDIQGSEKIEVLTGDIRDAHYCNEITKDVNIIFHLAALIAIPYSYQAPESYVDTNVKGTLNICQAAKENGCRVIHTSTSEVYGTAKYVPIDENHPLQPQSPYSATKIAADSIALSFHNAFDLPLTIVRPFNTYGPRQSARAVIPSIISQVLTTKDKTIRLGLLSPIRDLNFVIDTVDGFIKTAERDDIKGEVINIGSGQGISIGDLAKKIIQIVNKDIKIISESKRYRPEKSEVMELVCNNEKAKSLLSWVPKISLDDGLAQTVEFIKSHIEFYKPEIYNI